jgi:hypothetical protein
VDTNNPDYSSMAGVLFNKSQKSLLQWPAGKGGSYALPGGVTNIGSYAFDSCASLTSVVMPTNVTSIGDSAFGSCGSLTGLYFNGKPPSLGTNVFYGDTHATAFYLPKTTGWGTTFGGIPTALWRPEAQIGDGSFGVRTNRFGFDVTWTSNRLIVIEAATNLPSATWVPLKTNTFTNGLFYFGDPTWTNYHRRFYRVRAP